ncbi:SPOR domain-containing protein [Novosphingobium lentum]|uniref:SPOR domain-containing protein n=1 Tax=Novosphingobium lentum TaxID=145287 RepID=UPI0008362452|nr:SPOR domain-containing protein [Novosphingobium lentum]
MRHTATMLAATVLAATGAVGCAVTARADVKTGVDAWSHGDYAAAIKQWQVPAATGDPDAQFNLAQAYKMGRGVPLDLKKAEELYRRAAEQGHLQAGDNYGLLLFQTGRRQEAMPWLTASAGRGEPRAQYVLGIAHFNGDMVPKDWVRAYALMSRAASMGLPQATTSLATMDTIIPLDQRQEGVAMAAQLEQQADATRHRQLASADLGVKGAAPAAIRPSPIRPSMVPAPVAPTPVPPSTETGLTRMPEVAPPPAPVMAGADYANPVAVSSQDSRGGKHIRVPGRAAETPAPHVAAAAPMPVMHTAPAKAIPASGGGWRVQLGAFGQRANADALWARVGKRAELAGHERIDVPGGAVTRLQAGGFAGQADADRTCAALKAASVVCLPVKP